MKCPVCKLSTGFYQQERIKPGTFLRVPYPLYQRGYVVPPQKGIINCLIMEEGEKPISPRCEKCYDKAERKLCQKAERSLAKST